MEKPILVTGGHRSGSTWVGKVISTSPNIFYFHEPLHKSKIPILFKGTDPVWFPFINKENEQIYLEGYKQL